MSLDENMMKQLVEDTRRRIYLENTESVRIQWNLDEPSLGAVNQTINGLESDERIEFTNLIIKNIYANPKFVAELFGVDPKRPRLLTLCKEGEEFRAWHEVPYSISKYHADSMDREVVLSAYGCPKKVSRILDTFLQLDPKFEECTLKNGSKVYLRV